VKKVLLAIGGVLLALGLAILGRDGRVLKRLERQRDEEIAKNTADSLAKAKALHHHAEKRKADAHKAAVKTIEKLEKLSEKDHEMDDLLSAWQSERVRQHFD
jgi:hypothetical protein